MKCVGKFPRNGQWDWAASEAEASAASEAPPLSGLDLLLYLYFFRSTRCEALFRARGGGFDCLRWQPLSEMHELFAVFYLLGCCGARCAVLE